MKNWKHILILLSLLPVIGVAEPIHWFASLDLGAALARPGSAQTIQTQSTTDSNIYTNDAQTQINALAGAFVGVDIALSPLINDEIGLNYNYIQPYLLKGDIQQLSNPAFSNFNYEYNLQSQQLFIQSKLLLNLRHHLHPYILLGLGSAFNTAYDFSVTELDSTAVNPGVFTNHSNIDFAYNLGLGIDFNITKQVRIGAGYRYVNLGKAHLGTASDFISNKGPETSLNADELLVTTTYLF